MAKSQTTNVQDVQGFTPVETGVSFQGGIMHVAGQPQRPNQVEHWESSNGLTTYTTVEWIDPGTGMRRTSCNCPGWTRKKPGKPRGCMHTKDMEGTEPCTKRSKVDSIRIQSAQQAAAEIPEVDGKALRGIEIDWDD